jgi:D-sedoheptulose 7-phosphate isomerase
LKACVNLMPTLEQIAIIMSRTVLNGKKILWCGNGGSTADSEHLAAELVGRFGRERRALPSIARSTNTSILTAIGNDYGYDHVFRRQVEALCSAGDVLVGISTSGNSPNVCLALQAARKCGAQTIALTGYGWGEQWQPSNQTPRIQEGHILCGHMLCDYIEASIRPRDAEQATSVAR